ncbi:MAG TPA: glycosyltransferase family 2 protein, partial [Candidatus Obscuribacterales bacterium]
MTQPCFHVGIVLASYNCDLTYFKAQIESIQRQDFPHWTCLISDDGSTATIRAGIAAMIEGDRRFIFHPQPHNLGAYHNFEYGVNYFSQKPHITHIAFSDQDDIWHLHKLSTLLTAIETNNALLVHSDLELIDGQGQLLHPSVWEYEKRVPEKLDTELLLLRNSVTGCTMLMRRSLLPFILPFPPQSAAGKWYHDHWIALIAAQQGKIVHLRVPLVQYRQHGHNVVGARKDTGTIHKEIKLWLAKKGRLTLQSYPVHRDLSHAFYERCGAALDHWHNPFPAQGINFGFPIVRLGLRSLWQGYGGQGILLRL